MSSSLHRLSRWAFRHRRRVLALWLAALAAAVGLGLAANQGTDNTFTIPGTESQRALDQLGRTFPQLSGTSAQVIVVAAPGHTVTERAYRERIAAAARRLERVGGVRTVVSPYSPSVTGLVSGDRSAAIVRVQLAGTLTEVTDATKDAILREGPALRRSLPDGAVVSVGGDLYSTSLPTISPTEAVGVLIALFVLVALFRSFLAAGLPLATALLGVGVAMALISAATAIGTVSATTPMLALMIGLAVGIDYALFIISRHREELAAGVAPEEAAGRATATAGSAVIFAGATVFIALVGLAIAGIPFLTTMGLAASVAVALAVVIAVTLTPALLGFAGTRLVPRRPRRAHRRPGRLARRWVRAVTWRPPLTVAVVVAALVVVALPARDLRLALPTAGMLPQDSVGRQTYDLVTRHFSVGYNGPLIVTGTIVTSDDPVGLMTRLGEELGRVEGVRAVLLATPNERADTGIVQIVPESAPGSAATARLVDRLRGLEGRFRRVYGVELSVTGHAAVAIDVSERLSQALLPFGLFVIGLSVVLLTMVFRSIAVPVKAALGYLLSITAALGATAFVFVEGHGAGVIDVAKVGPVISFLPIILMGVLFGLAMDYEVFLVSRMREAFVHNGGNAHAAIEEGFVSSARVVAAAAAIMFSVFAAFVPEGDGVIKPIAFGLAVGVFVDAFVVRMTLVPAVLALLGRRAWWMPRRIERAVPHFDVEGEAITRALALDGWPGPGIAIAARGLALADGDDTVFADVAAEVPAGGVLVAEAADRVRGTALLLTIAGRARPTAGDLRVAGGLLPADAGRVRRRVGVALLAGAHDPAAEIREAAAPGPAVLVVDGSDAVADPRARDRVSDALADALDAAGRAGRPLTLVLASARAGRACALLPDGHGPVTTIVVPSAAARKEPVPA